MTFALSREEISAIANQVAEIVLAKLRDAQSQRAEALLTEREVASHCRVEVSSIRLARRTGKLRCVRVGRYPRFRRADVDAWLLSMGQKK